MKKAVVLILLCCLLATLLSCGGSNSTIVFISPATATVNAGASLQFTANVPVTWSVSGNGVIDAAGFFKAGNTAGTVTISAFATDGSRSSGTATVTISTTGTTTTTTTTTSAPSGIAHRVFVSNKFAGVLNIVNADTDLLSTHSVSVGGLPTFMLQTSDLTVEVVYDSANNILEFVDNTTEAVTSPTLTLAGAINSAALIPGATAAYAAVPTAFATDSNGNSVTGAVYRADFSSGGFLSVGIQGVRFISMDHNAVNMLAFSQYCDTVTLVTSSAGALTSNTGTLKGTVLPSGATNCTTTSFSRPVAAVFSSDDTTAYVLSSGPVNGGTQAMVTVLDMTQSPPAVLKTIPVSGANVGLLQGTQLYVAGAQFAPCTSDATQTCQQAVLTVIDTSTNTVTGSVPFGQSAPNLVPGVLTFDGTNLWIGSTGCQIPAGAPGCLSLYFPASGQAVTNVLPGVLTDQTDDVTGMVWLQPFNKREIMYVIEGGELLIYDNSFNLLTQNGSQIVVDIVGQAVDVKAVK
ncbi:MAG: hypothetical protein ABR866_02445 [Candidatus Korobacteraceae bacterium]